ncbi:hypothetical protein ACFQ6N_32080 [Kitasatospora sp. NPDC056446]|uniref:hypothetical protein n=1 Tax=Kitasatospora sp. NPDC056446 TaxID=3345819 RepID=UPI0036A473BD
MRTGVGARVVKAVSRAGVAVLLVGALAACGGGSPAHEAAPTMAGGSADTSAGGTASAAPAAQAAPTTPAAQASPAAPGSLRLTAPESLPGGYRAQGPADVRAGHPAGPQPAGYESFDGSLVARYVTDSGGIMTIGGAWGTIADPDAVAAAAIAAMQSPRTTWPVPPADVDARDPHDPQGRLTCGVLTEALIVMPLCIWVDHYTAGSVSFPPSAQGSPTTLGQADAANRTRRIRDAMTAAE